MSGLWGIRFVIVFCSVLFLAFGVFAQGPEELKPGIMPDSAFYFLDSMFEGFQSSESVANEKTAEMVAMAKKNKVEAMEKARERYEMAMRNRQRESEDDEEETEKVVRQASRHLEVLADVYESVPEQGKKGIERAMQSSAGSMNNSIKRMRRMNPEKGDNVAAQVLAGVYENAPLQAREGLRKALGSVSDKGANASGEAIEPSGRGDGSDEAMERGSKGDSGLEVVDGSESDIEGGKNFRLMVSDAPADIGDFDYLEVELTKARIFSGGSEDDEDEEEEDFEDDLNESEESGNESDELNESGDVDSEETGSRSSKGFEEKELNSTVDITRLVGASSLEVLSTNLEPGKYNKIELYVGDVDAKVDNESADVKVPSGKLQIVKPFEIVDGEVTTFVFDINVVRKGFRKEYNLIPVIAKSGVVNEDLDEDEVEEVEVECRNDSDCSEGSVCKRNECEAVEDEEDEEDEEGSEE